MKKKTPTIVRNLQKQLRDLSSDRFDLERRLFEAEQFVEIGAKKVAIWVDKHDTLLIKFKAMVNVLTPEQKQQLDI